MVTCARCGRDVDDVETVTPDVITKEVLDSIDHGETDLAGREGEMKICTECMDELRGD
jgi:hypothetical protein